MKIVFIGAGNVATSLSKVFVKKGHEIIQVISKSSSSASSLAQIIKCSFSADLHEIKKEADLYFICVNDNQVANVVDNLPTVNGLVLHTSGSTPLDIFPERFENTAVFYPLQSFSRFKESDLTNVPIFIEVNRAENEPKLKFFSEQISSRVSVVNSQQRAAIHVCGVFANNFTNHLYYLAYKLAKENEIPFEVFFPIIKETAEKIVHRSPLASQTGPAARNDINIIEKHREFLVKNPEILKIYNLITESIIKFSR